MNLLNKTLKLVGIGHAAPEILAEPTTLRLPSCPLESKTSLLIFSLPSFADLPKSVPRTSLINAMEGDVVREETDTKIGKNKKFK